MRVKCLFTGLLNVFINCNFNGFNPMTKADVLNLQSWFISWSNFVQIKLSNYINCCNLNTVNLKLLLEFHHTSLNSQMALSSLFLKFFYSILLFRANDPIKWFLFYFCLIFLLVECYNIYYSVCTYIVANVHEKFMLFLVLSSKPYICVICCCNFFVFFLFLFLLSWTENIKTTFGVW